MAKLSVIICDLCKKLGERLGFKLQLSAGRDKPTKADICQVCFDGLKTKVESEVNLTSLTSPSKAGDMGAVVPSSAPNVATPPASRSIWPMRALKDQI